MRYEICKVTGMGNCYVAESDTWEWADKIKDALEAWEGGKYQIYAGGVMVRDIQQAMEMSMGIKMSARA